MWELSNAAITGTRVPSDVPFRLDSVRFCMTGETHAVFTRSRRSAVMDT